MSQQKKHQRAGPDADSDDRVRFRCTVCSNVCRPLSDSAQAITRFVEDEAKPQVEGRKKKIGKTTTDPQGQGSHY